MKHRLLNNNTVSFPLTDTNWEKIINRCKNRSGVYAIINNINSKCYIGSSVHLYNRIRDYHQPAYQVSRKNTLIIKAIIKYGISNFTFVVLEYTEKELTVTIEQQYINKFSPEYNILKTAFNSLGYKHTEKDKIKISKAKLGYKHIDNVRIKISEQRKGSNHNFYNKQHTQETKILQRIRALNRIKDPKPGYLVIVHDNITNTTITYKSIRIAAIALKCTRTTLFKYNNLTIRKQYTIKIINYSG